MKLKLAGIIRKKEHSPNHEINDYMILYETAKVLRESGAEIKLYYEKDLEEIEIEENLIFSMVLSLEGYNILQHYEKSGKAVINPPDSILKCYRRNMIETFEQSNIPFPKSLIVTPASLNGEVHLFDSENIWMKQTNLNSVKSENRISIKGSEKEIRERIKKFVSDPEEKIILQEDLIGDSIKFYGIRETGFFHYYHSENTKKSNINENHLREIASYTAEIMNLYIYGGDAIILPDGSISIIDINNWPSFAPIRKQAAIFIAKLLLKKFREFNKNFSTVKEAYDIN